MVQRVRAGLVERARIGEIESAAEESDAGANGNCVRRRKNENAAGAAEAMHFAHEGEGVFEMLDAFYGDDEVEARAGPRKFRGEIGDAKSLAENHACSVSELVHDINA